MTGAVYGRLLPYEAEIWTRGYRWRGNPEAFAAEVAHTAGGQQILVPTTAGNPLPKRIAGVEVKALPVGLARLPLAARLTGVAGVYRSAPPFCEGDLLAQSVQPGERAVLLLLGPETVGWAVRNARLCDAFRTLDEEAMGTRTTGAVESRWALGRLAEEGDVFARRLFGAAGLLAQPDGLPAWRHRLRMAAGRLAAALGARPDTICLGGEAELVQEARQVLGDLAPIRIGQVDWGIGGWARQREGIEGAFPRFS